MYSLPNRTHIWDGEYSDHAQEGAMEDEQLISKESHGGDAEYSVLHDSQRRLKRWIVALSVLLGVSLLALFIAVNGNHGRDRDTAGALTPVPPIPSTRVTFEQDDRFAGPSSQERDEAWTAMMPLGDGFVVIPNDTAQHTYDLPLGKSSQHGQIYDISVFHQLHCLAHIRRHLFTLQASMDRENIQEIYHLLIEPQEDHVFHCFDYIRQALMCAGDMTVEWPRTEEDGSRFAVDGWGITHQCKDWSAIMRYMERESVANIW